jgi:hypothetical protein
VSRRRWIQINGELVEVTSEDQIPIRAADAAAHGILWNDRAYQDMNDPRFKSRTEHREFMKRHNLTTVDDMKETWRKAEEKRINIRKGVDPQRKRDIEVAIEKVKQGYKPHLVTRR